MSHRPLVLVSGLTLGDYLLWNWSLGANHDVLALVSGLLLPALVVAFIWLLALSLTRLLARSGGRPPARTIAGGHGAQRDRADRNEGAAFREHPAPAGGTGTRDQGEDDAVTDSPASSPGKLAA